MKNLLSACATAGIAEWVCCPSSLNTPLMELLAQLPGTHCWSIADEPSAAAFALGRCQASTRPLALLGSSTAAATSMLPAVTEAFYQRRPLLVITIDEQTDLEGEAIFGNFANCIDIKLPCSGSDIPPLRELMAECQPLHLRLLGEINQETESVGLSDISVVDPAPAPPFRGSLVDLSQMLRFNAYEGLVLMLGSLEPNEQEPALWMARALRVPTLADASSGLREELSGLRLHLGDSILKQQPPRNILRLGEMPQSAFWSELEQLHDSNVFSISRSGFSGLRRPTVNIEGDIEQIMKAVGDVPHVGDINGLMAPSRKIASKIEELMMSFPECVAAMLRYFSQQACIADVISIGGARTRQLWDDYAQSIMPTVYLRNRSHTGAGIISTFFGNAADAQYACCLVDRLSLLRDTAAGNIASKLTAGKRVIAVINDGSEEPETLSLPELAQLWGAQYYAIYCESDFEVLESLEESALVILEIKPDLDQTQDFARYL